MAPGLEKHISARIIRGAAEEGSEGDVSATWRQWWRASLEGKAVIHRVSALRGTEAALGSFVVTLPMGSGYFCPRYPADAALSRSCPADGHLYRGKVGRRQIGRRLLSRAAPSLEESCRLPYMQTRNSWQNQHNQQRPASARRCHELSTARAKICHGVPVTTLCHKTPEPVPAGLCPLGAGGTSVSSASARRASPSRRHPGRSLRAGTEGWAPPRAERCAGTGGGSSLPEGRPPGVPRPGPRERALAGPRRFPGRLKFEKVPVVGGAVRSDGGGESAGERRGGRGEREAGGIEASPPSPVLGALWRFPHPPAWKTRPCAPPEAQRGRWAERIAALSHGPRPGRCEREWVGGERSRSARRSSGNRGLCCGGKRGPPRHGRGCAAPRWAKHWFLG